MWKSEINPTVQRFYFCYRSDVKNFPVEKMFVCYDKKVEVTAKTVLVENETEVQN